MHPSDYPAYWRKTRSLAITTIVVIFVLTIVIHVLFQDTSDIVVLDFPLNYYLAALFTPLALLVLVVWHALYQRVVEREHDVFDD